MENILGMTSEWRKVDKEMWSWNGEVSEGQCKQEDLEMRLRRVVRISEQFGFIKYDGWNIWLENNNRIVQGRTEGVALCVCSIVMVLYEWWK